MLPRFENKKRTRADIGYGITHFKKYTSHDIVKYAARCGA